jgi:hypothetical protein
LRYFLPADERSLAIERARIALSSRAQIDPGVKEFFGRLEPGMRAVAAMGLEGFIASESMNATVDLVRLWTSGIAISAVEHPEISGDRTHVNENTRHKTLTAATARP